MSRWIDASAADLSQSAYMIAEDKNITESAVEKDWWVTAILKVLFSMSTAQYMFFKGGTSLSKGWGLIDRFSEDIDIALHHDFYLYVKGKDCAKATTNNQIKNLRIANRDFIVGEFTDELKSKLSAAGYEDCVVAPIIEKPDGSPVDHDSDPVVIELRYPAKLQTDSYVRPVVKIEVSCLSMKEPFEIKRISSLVGEAYPMLDDETFAEIPTITPTRTFLEKAFLLNEEYQRKSPRTDRMSRHLYDLERLMDTTYASDALSDTTLYHEIIEHRRKFYHVGGVNYDLDNHDTIAFCPTGEIRKKMQVDYEAMKESMIYGEKLDFDALMSRLETLQQRFRAV